MSSPFKNCLLFWELLSHILEVYCAFGSRGDLVQMVGLWVFCPQQRGKAQPLK